jgi:hypothetical protein
LNPAPFHHPAWRNLWRRLSALLLFILFISTVFRALTQSITIDEAFTWQSYLAGPFSLIFTAPYDANNHVLSTVLCWASIHLLGTSEFSLRLPSLLASAAFFLSVFRISTTFFNDRPAHLLSTCLLAGNPYLLDFFTVARGYGLAIAFFAMALATLMSAFDRRRLPSMSLLKISTYSAFSVAANLTFAFPVLALFFALVAIEAGNILTGKSSERNYKLRAISLLVPFAVISLSLLSLPLSTATRDTFYFGSGNWRRAIDSAIDPSMNHNYGRPAFLSIPPLYKAKSFVLHRGAIAVVPPLFLLIVILSAARLLLRRPIEPAQFLPPLLLTATVALLESAHLLGTKLPLMRTTIDLVFLLSLALISLLAWPLKTPERTAGLLLVPAYLFMAALYVLEWPADAAWDWIADRQTRQFAHAIEVMRIYSGRDSISVGGSWIFEPVLNFYRLTVPYPAWQPISRQAATDPADVYLLSREDRAIAKDKGLRIILEDTIGQTLLAVPPLPSQ